MSLLQPVIHSMKPYFESLGVSPPMAAAAAGIALYALTKIARGLIEPTVEVPGDLGAVSESAG